MNIKRCLLQRLFYTEFHINFIVTELEDGFGVFA